MVAVLVTFFLHSLTTPYSSHDLRWQKQSVDLFSPCGFFVQTLTTWSTFFMTDRRDEAPEGVESVADTAGVASTLLPPNNETEDDSWDKLLATSSISSPLLASASPVLPGLGEERRWRRSSSASISRSNRINAGMVSMPSRAPSRATSNRHNTTLFSFFRSTKSSVSNSRHSFICIARHHRRQPEMLSRAWNVFLIMKN